MTTAKGIAPGESTCRMFVIVGNQDIKRESMRFPHTSAEESNAQPSKGADP